MVQSDMGKTGAIVMPPEMNQLYEMLMERGEGPAAGNLLGMASVRQALFDVFGAYPAANVLPYAYNFELSTRLGASADPEGPLAANGTKTASIKITADSAFIARYVTGSSTGAYLNEPRIDASDRQLVNRPVHSSAWVGTGERPNILPKPLLLPANTTISFSLTDLSGSTNSVFFTLIGFKIYGYTPAT